MRYLLGYGKHKTNLCISKWCWKATSCWLNNAYDLILRLKVQLLLKTGWSCLDGSFGTLYLEFCLWLCWLLWAGERQISSQGSGVHPALLFNPTFTYVLQGRCGWTRLQDAFAIHNNNADLMCSHVRTKALCTAYNTKHGSSRSSAVNWIYEPASHAINNQ